MSYCGSRRYGRPGRVPGQADLGDEFVERIPAWPATGPPCEGGNALWAPAGWLFGGVSGGWIGSGFIWARLARGSRETIFGLLQRLDPRARVTAGFHGVQERRAMGFELPDLVRPRIRGGDVPAPGPDSAGLGRSAGSGPGPGPPSGQPAGPETV